jgi:TP901 family phage tail tape measure protein
MAVQINVAANQAALVQSIQAGVQAYNQRFANQNQINLQVNARGFSQPLGRITGDVKDFEAALAASNARVIAFGASTAILGGVLRGFRSIAEVTVEVEKNLADINRVFGLTTKELQKFSTDLFNVSKQTASSFGDASKAALEFSRQGVKAEEVLQRTADAMTLARLAGMNVNNAIEALTATVNGFQATGITTTQVLNKLVAVEQSYAVSAGDLAEALSRTGLAAQEAGVNIDQLNALVTAAQEKTARGGAVIGNALKTIFTRLQRTETLDQLEAFNIGVRDIQGNILPAVQILQNFAGAYNSLADSQRAQLSEQVAGVYQVNILKAIIGDLNNKQGAYAGALQKGAMATNEAQIAAAKLNQTLDALLSQTSTVAQQFANNVGKVTFEPLAKYTAESFKSLFENLNEILEGEGLGSTFANGLLKGIRNVLAGPGAIGAFFVLFKLIQNSFTYLSQALPQIVGITTETQNRKNIEQAILQIMQQQGPVAQALAGQMGNQTAQAQLLLQLARQQTAEYQRQQALVAALAPALSAQGVSARGQQGLRVTRSGGYIPKEAKLQETIGALAGGYTPGQVIKSPVGGVMNSAEQVKYMPGFAQPFINPPANSDAGRTHRRNSINRTGVDPYMNNGFIPNFYIDSTDKKRFQSAKIIEGNLFEKELYTKLDTGTEPPGATLDFPTGKLESVRSKNRQTTLSVGIDDQTLYGDAKLSLNSSNITSMISKYIRAGNKFIIGDTVFDDKNYSILYKYGPPDNLLTNKTRKLSSLLKHNPSLIHNIGHRLIDMRTGNRLNKAGENTKIGLTFFGDKVDIGQTSASGFIPNLASSQLPAEYRNPITGKLNNPKIAAAIRMGKLDPAVAMAAGYKTSSQSIQERKQGALERVLSSGFKKIGISGIGILPSSTTASQTNPFAKNFERLALEKAKQMFATNNIVFASNYEKGGKRFHGAPGNTRIDALEDNLTGPVIEMKSGDTTPDAKVKTKFTQAKNELIEMWHSAMPKEKLDTIVQSIGARPEYLFYNADKEIKRGTEQIIQASTGFIPNFAAIDRNILRDMIKFNIANASSSTKGLKNVELSRSVKGRGKRWQSLSEQYNKNIPENEIINAVFASRYQETGNPFFEKRFMQQSIQDTIERHQSDVPDFSGGENFKKSPFVSTSLKKSSAFAHASITGGEIIKQQKVRLSRILNKQAYSLLIDKYGEEKVKETILNLSKLKGGKGIGFDVNDFLKTHYDIIRSKGKVAYRESENEVAILSKGFIPNFAADYINRVMDLESNMSGNKAVLDTKTGPFPFIRNASQPNFAAAISDHGGMNKALNDSYKNQVAAGLMNKGFIPNFAPFDITGTSLQRSGGGAVSHKKINKAINDYINSINLSTTSNKDISDALTKLLPQFNLNQQSLNEVRRAAIDYAEAQRTAATQTQKQAQEEARNKRRERVDKFMNSALFAAPMIAGQLESAVFGNRQRTEMTGTERGFQSALSTGLTSVSTAASIGNMILPGWGAAIGAGVGALFGLTQAIGATNLSFEELNQIASEYKNQTQENISSGQKYIDTLNLLQTSTDPKIIEKASRELELSFKSIKDVKLQDQFRKAGTDIDKLTKSLSDYEQKRVVVQKRKETIAETTGLAQMDIKTLEKRGLDVKKLAGGGGGKELALTENNLTIISDTYSSFFDELNKLSEDQVKSIDQALKKTELSTGNVDEVNLRKVLTQIPNLTQDQIDFLVQQGEIIGQSGSASAGFAKRNLLKLQEQYRKNRTVQNTQSDEQIKAANDFQNFRFNLIQGLTDDLKNASDAIKTFEFKSDIQNLITSKLKDIGDAVYSSILTNISEIRSFTIKESQAKFISQNQLRQIQENLSQAEETAANSQAQILSDYRKKIAEKLTNVQGGIIPGEKQQNLINQFITGPTKSREELQKLSAGLFNSDQTEKTKEFAETLKDLQDGFIDSNLQAQRTLELKRKEIAYSEILNKVNEQVSLQQIKYERERLAISLAQKTATESLRYETESQKIKNTQGLELTKISQGGEFRYLGLNLREEFYARQKDQQQLFNKEQELAQQQAIAQARQSLIEIASQEANTIAQDHNTQAILDLTDAIIQQQINENQLDYYSQFTKSPEQQAINSERLKAAQDLRSRNIEARAAYQQSQQSLQNIKLNDYGLSNQTTLADAIKKLEDEQAKQTNQFIKAQYQETIDTLKLSSEQLGSDATIYAAKTAQAKADFEQSQGFVNNIGIGFKNLSKESDEILNTLGRKLPSAFADGMTNALMEVAKGTKSIGDAFTDMAINFGQMLMQEVMRAAIGKVLGNAFSSVGSIFQTGGIVGKQRGGIIRAENGAYIPGNRNGDRNLALLEDGEYVLNREAVSAIGVNNLHSLNYGMAPRFQSGGGFGLSAEQALVGDELKYSGMLMESGQANKPINIEDYTAYAYAEDTYFKDMRQKAVQAEQERIQKVYEDKVKNLQLMTSIMGAVGSIALSVGMAGVSAGGAAGGAAKKTVDPKVVQGAAAGATSGVTAGANVASQQIASGTASALSGSLSGADMGMITGAAAKGLTPAPEIAKQFSEAYSKSNYAFAKFISKNPNNLFFNGKPLQSLDIGKTTGFRGFSNLQSFFGKSQNQNIYRNLFPNVLSSGRDVISSNLPRRQTGGLVGYQSGGFIPYGSRISDNVPRYMSGGINLMNNASKKYVMGNTPRFQDGGSNGVSNTTNNSTNSTNIAINIDKSGTTVIGESGNNYSNNDYQFSKQLATVVSKIADARISDAKRSGGALGRGSSYSS